MPRIRSIKPEFWDSPSTAHASAVARLAFIAMWNWADDHGVGTANLKELEGFIFPNDDISELSGGKSRNFRDVAAEVSDAFGVVFYTVQGRPYYEIPTWNRHQRNERAAKGKYPTSNHADKPLTCENTTSGGTSDNFRYDMSEAPKSSGPGTGEQGNRGTGELFSSEVADATSDEARTRTQVEQLCTTLADRIEANGSKRPTITKRWRDACRLMLDRDGRTVEQIAYLIDWSQADEFWRANIQSMPKLRDKFDQLRLKATTQTNDASRRQQQVDGVYERAMQRATSGETP